MISLRRKPVLEEPLPDDVKAYWREMVEVPNPLADIYPPGLIPLDRKPRFYVERCPHCFGVHAEACPRVKSVEHYENGQVKSVTYFATGEYDDSGTLWATQVFAD